MFDNVFKPIKIGTLEVKNRLARSAGATNYANLDGSATPMLLDFYWEEAKGGVGLVMVETSYIDEVAAKGLEREFAVSRDDCLPDLAKLAQGIKDNGARAGIQLGHLGGGRQVGDPLLAPSAVEYQTTMGPQMPREATVEEIKAIVEAFGDAALRAKKAGFDIVEVHAGHEHGLGQFLSPYLNLRTDDYGGSFENRMRLPLEAFENVRSKVGKDFPICVKISTTDFMPGGLPVEEAIEFARRLEKAGADAIHASAGGLMTVHHTITPVYFPQACNVDLSAMIKKAVSIPVLAVGSINRMELAEEILAAGKADMVAICRPLMADPYFPQKGKEGRLNDIRPCIRCTEGCFSSIVANAPVKCTVNAELATEYEQTLEPVASPKKVAVVGGGPAGMEAARVAAIKGHKVTLYEKRDLGGNLIEDSTSDYKKERKQLITYFKTQLDRLGVAIKKEEASAQTLQEAGFDAVILATGANKRKADLKGEARPSVIHAVEAYQGEVKGDKVVIVASDWQSGCCDVALYLVEQGKKVTLLFPGDMMEMMVAVAMVNSATDMLAIWEQMAVKGVEVVYSTRFQEITDAAVVAADPEGKKATYTADTVIVPPVFTPNDSLAKALAGTGMNVYSVGDCVEPRRILNAIHEGHAIARAL
ncbi:MAG: FAD-dependent oxidoreductase [Chloroflexi bacterium]|nr:FAD-dependent oxidoreductase [Chloroflexota bacterium]